MLKLGINSPPQFLLWVLMIIARARVDVTRGKKGNKYYYLYVGYIPELEGLEGSDVLLIIIDDKSTPMYLAAPVRFSGNEGTTRRRRRSAKPAQTVQATQAQPAQPQPTQSPQPQPEFLDNPWIEAIRKKYVGQ